MKILHTSDWHLGKRLAQFSRLPEQEAVLSEICDIAEEQKVDAVIIAGDLFDTYNPPTEAVELFYKTLKRLSNDGKRAVIAFAGNHDSPDRIESPEPLARECGIIFSGYPYSTVRPFKIDTGLAIKKSDSGFIELNIPGSTVPLRLIITPYANEVRLKTYLGNENIDNEFRSMLSNQWKVLAGKYCDKNGVNILAGHLFFMEKGGKKPQESEDEKTILYPGGATPIFSQNVPPEIQYTALGHLHRKQEILGGSSPVYYSGSPLSYSFSEANQKKFVCLIEAQPAKKVVLQQIELKTGKKLLRKKFDKIEKAVNWLNLNPTVWVELTIVTEKFITAVERKQLVTSHDGIVAIIPELSSESVDGVSRASEINLNQSIEQLFCDYFESKTGQEPNSELLEIFNEIISI